MPRNLNGAGSIRKKTVKGKNGKDYIFYEARVTVGYDPTTGKQKQKSISGKTKTEIRKRMTKLMAEVDKGLYLEESDMLLKDWLDIWLETYIEGKVKPFTADSYRRNCKNHIKLALGDVRLSKLTTVQIQKFYNSLQQTKKLSPKTIKNIHGTLHPALSRAVKNGLICTNPSDLCDLPKVIKKEIKPLEQNDISVLLDTWKNSKYRNVFLVTLFTGLRQGEVLGLTWDCVDFENESIYINKQLTKTNKVGGAYCLATTKSSQSRLIFVAPTVMDVLRQQKRHQDILAKAAGSGWNNEWNLVFTNELGGHLVHVTVYKQFKRFVRAAGFDNTRFHDLRHSYAVASLESGDDIKTLQENLGHASAAFTMNVYAHASKKMHKRSAANMENYIRSVS